MPKTLTRAFERRSKTVTVRVGSERHGNEHYQTSTRSRATSTGSQVSCIKPHGNRPKNKTCQGCRQACAHDGQNWKRNDAESYHRWTTQQPHRWSIKQFTTGSNYKLFYKNQHERTKPQRSAYGHYKSRNGEEARAYRTARRHPAATDAQSRKTTKKRPWVKLIDLKGNDGCEDKHK